MVNSLVCLNNFNLQILSILTLYSFALYSNFKSIGIILHYLLHMIMSVTLLYIIIIY